MPVVPSQWKDLWNTQRLQLDIRGRPLMIWGGPGEIEEKKISEALLQEKINLKRTSPGKNKSQKAFPKKK